MTKSSFLRNAACSLALGVLLIACQAYHGDAGSTILRKDSAVQVHGELRAMMHEGAIGAAVDLDDLLPRPGLYGLGALTDLRGEVTILDGRVHLAYPAELSKGNRVVTTASGESAALLVSAEVSAWTSHPIATTVPFEQFDATIEALAVAVGLDPTTRIPFLIDGICDELAAHVIDGRRLPPGPSSHAEHQAAATQWQRQDVHATLLGFYSASDQGVFTHRDSRTHVHCVVDEVTTGHVDRVVVRAGAVIRFPARRPIAATNAQRP